MICLEHNPLFTNLIKNATSYPCQTMRHAIWEVGLVLRNNRSLTKIYPDISSFLLQILIAQNI